MIAILGAGISGISAGYRLGIKGIVTQCSRKMTVAAED